MVCCGGSSELRWFVVQTTLLNHILTAQHGKRIAVIENEVTQFTSFMKLCNSCTASASGIYVYFCRILNLRVINFVVVFVISHGCCKFV